MTQEEQKQIDQLRQQLDNAKKSVDDVRSFLSAALIKSNDEARLYRGLFWCLLGFATVALIVNLLQR